MTHYQSIPNWQLFKLRFKPSSEFVEKIESRFDTLKTTSEYEAIAKYINVQIGILNLRDREKGQEVMKEFSEILKN